MKTTNCYMSRCFICVNNFRNTNKSIWWYECYQMIDDMNNMCFFIFVYCLMLWIFEIRAIIVAAALSGRGRSNLVAGLATLGDAGMMFEWKKTADRSVFIPGWYLWFFYIFLYLDDTFLGIFWDTWGYLDDFCKIGCFQLEVWNQSPAGKFVAGCLLARLYDLSPNEAMAALILGHGWWQIIYSGFWFQLFHSPILGMII